MNQELSMNANQLVAFFQKPTSEFTKADIVSFIREKDIRMVNFMYPVGDGRLKTLTLLLIIKLIWKLFSLVENG